MRSSPTPSAPSVTAFAASLAEPRLAKTSIRLPSLVAPGSCARSRARRAPGRHPFPALARRALGLSRWIDLNGALAAVHQDGRALLDPEHDLADPDHGRQPERTGEDRGVRGGGAVGGGDPGHAARIERRGIGRGQLAGDYDPG